MEATEVYKNLTDALRIIRCAQEKVGQFSGVPLYKNGDFTSGKYSGPDCTSPANQFLMRVAHWLSSERNALFDELSKDPEPPASKLQRIA